MANLPPTIVGISILLQFNDRKQFSSLEAERRQTVKMAYILCGVPTLWPSFEGLTGWGKLWSEALSLANYSLNNGNQTVLLQEKKNGPINEQFMKIEGKHGLLFCFVSHVNLFPFTFSNSTTGFMTLIYVYLIECFGVT